MQKLKIFIGIIILFMSNFVLSQDAWQSQKDEKRQGAELKDTPKTIEAAATSTPKETDKMQITESALKKIKNGEKLEAIELQALIKQIEAIPDSEANYATLSIYKTNKENDRTKRPCELIPDLPVCDK